MEVDFPFGHLSERNYGNASRSGVETDPKMTDDEIDAMRKSVFSVYSSVFNYILKINKMEKKGALNYLKLPVLVVSTAGSSARTWCGCRSCGGRDGLGEMVCVCVWVRGMGVG